MDGLMINLYNPMFSFPASTLSSDIECWFQAVSRGQSL